MDKIIICGLPGTGKTTLCKRLVSEADYIYVNDWEILKGFGREVFNEDRVAISKNLSGKIDDYVKTLADQKTVIDLDYSALPEDFLKFSTKDNVKMLYFGFDGIPAEILYKVMLKTSDEDGLMDKVRYYVEISKFVKAECEKHGLTFVPINAKREETLNAVYEKLIG